MKYHLVVEGDNFIQNYNVQASSLQKASLIARTSYLSEFKSPPRKVKIHIDDIANHIQELFEMLNG